MKPDHEYGLLIEPVNRYGTDYIEARGLRTDLSTAGARPPRSC